MAIEKNEEGIKQFSEALAKNIDKYYQFYYEEIMSKLPEYIALKIEPHNIHQAYGIFYGCMMDRAQVSGKITWDSISKVLAKDKTIFDPLILLEKYPEKKDCKEKRKDESNCYAKKFIADFIPRFPLQHAHGMFRAAHFFKENIENGTIESILDLPELSQYYESINLYREMVERIYKTGNYPKTLSLAFRLLSANNHGKPEGNLRFWKYSPESLSQIPMLSDYWIVFFSFKVGLIKATEDTIINPSDAFMKKIIKDTWHQIGKACGIPPIFIDPSIWAYSRTHCASNRCDSCLLNDSFNLNCQRRANIHRILSDAGIYFIHWDESGKDKYKAPERYTLQLKPPRGERLCHL